MQGAVQYDHDLLCAGPSAPDMARGPCSSGSKRQNTRAFATRSPFQVSSLAASRNR